MNERAPTLFARVYFCFILNSFLKIMCEQRTSVRRSFQNVSTDITIFLFCPKEREGEWGRRRGLKSVLLFEVQNQTFGALESLIYASCLARFSSKAT